MSMDEDTRARDRLLAYTAVRFAGLAIFFFGIAVMYTNLLRPGGWPQVGAIIVILGVIDAVLAPRVLKKAWDRQDRDQE
jgi:membrane protein implicated in regulation of membrane protease activity